MGRAVQRMRIRLRPEPIGRDERVEHDGDVVRQVGDVVRQLEDAALLFGNVLDRLAPWDWGPGSSTTTHTTGALVGLGCGPHLARGRPPRGRHPPPTRMTLPVVVVTGPDVRDHF